MTSATVPAMLLNMNKQFKTSTHSVALVVMMTGQRVVSLFPVGADGEPDTDTELFYQAFNYHEEKEALACFKAQRASVAPPAVTAERATEIIRQARAAAKVGPWVDRLDDVTTVDERAAIKLNWEGRPGNWSFANTLTAIARGK